VAFISAAPVSNCSRVTSPRSVPVWNYSPSSPVILSFEGHCQGARRSLDQRSRSASTSNCRQLVASLAWSQVIVRGVRSGRHAHMPARKSWMARAVTVRQSAGQHQPALRRSTRATIAERLDPP